MWHRHSCLCFSLRDYFTTTDVDCCTQSRRRLSEDSLRTLDRSLQAGLERDLRPGRDTNARQAVPACAEFRESPRCNPQTGCVCRRGRSSRPSVPPTATTVSGHFVLRLHDCDERLPPIRLLAWSRRPTAPCVRPQSAASDGRYRI